MTKFSGAQFNIGIGKESSRATPVAAAYWLPKTSLTVDDKVKVAKNETTVGVIEEGVGQEVSNRNSEAVLEGRVTDQSFGLLLMATMGTDTVGAVETGVKDHAFTVLQNAQHPALSISVTEPNAGSGLVYPLGMVDSLEIMFELDKYVMYKATLKANRNAAQSNTAAYVTENAFRPQDMTFKLASALSGLAGASAISIKKGQISIKKNTEDDEVLGSVDPADRLNKRMAVEGTFELFYTDRTHIDTDMLGDIFQAMSFTVKNTAVTIGAVSNPTLTVRLARVKYNEVARKIDNNGIVSQTIKFKAFYSLSDTEMLDITLRNTVTTSY